MEITLSSSLSPDIESNNFPKILITSPGYESMEITPYKGDGTAKTDLGVIVLTSTTEGLEQDKIKASQLNTDQIKKISKGEKTADYYTQERLSNQINTIKTTLLPTVLTLIAGFGVTKASNLAAQNQDKILDAVKNISTCPTQLELTSIINKKNKLVKQLNNILKSINNTTKALGITGGVIEALDIAYNVLKNLPIPSSTGVLGVPGLPINVILAIQDNKDKIDKLINKLKKINTSILSILVLLRQVLLQVIQLLNLLDKLVEKCYSDANQDPYTNQEQISAELTLLTNEQSNQTSPIITDVNGFTMGVETEPQISTLSIKRRRATATNKQGVIMLTGEWSFSSIDQILIDELVFYIQTNDLRAD